MSGHVEIAQYPMRCHVCGKAGVVRELANTEITGYFHRNVMYTARVAPEGWTVKVFRGMPMWVCPECSGSDSPLTAASDSSQVGGRAADKN